eukprot:scaffold120396_cov20-Prasinocladus_malaysianus.AAC.1
MSLIFLKEWKLLICSAEFSLTINGFYAPGLAAFIVSATASAAAAGVVVVCAAAIVFVPFHGVGGLSG